MIDAIRMTSLILNEDMFDYGKTEIINIGQLPLIRIRSPKVFENFKYQREERNLVFTLRASEFRICNSLHKFQQGHNYRDFTFSELCKSIAAIESLTQMPASDFCVKQLEFGINISLSEPGVELLPLFGDYKGKEYDKMKDRGFWYGVKYNLSEYTLKIYDKTALVKRKANIDTEEYILRLEIQYKTSRKLQHACWLSDLKNKIVLQNIFGDFIKTIKNVNIIGGEDFSSLKPRKRELYFAGLAPHFWAVEKNINKNTAKSKRKDFRELQNLITRRDKINELVQQLETKFNYLLIN